MEFTKTDNLIIGLAVLVLLVMGFNAYQMSGLSVNAKPTGNAAAETMQQPGTTTADLGSLLPKGIPEIYGKELGVSYDDVSSSDQKKADETIKRLGMLDNQIKLNGDDLSRYISVASQISCEYCCGTDSIILSNGQPACSCQHSFAMRGLAKYLIKNHGSEYSDSQVLEELSKWKVLFFPGPMSKKALVMKEKGIELNYINLASNKYRGIEN